MRSQIVSFISERLFRTIRAIPAMAGLSVGVLLAAALSGSTAHGQTLPKPAPEAAPQAVPGFWDPRRRPDRPDLSRITVIRFLRATDYPPFNVTGPDGTRPRFTSHLGR